MILIHNKPCNMTCLEQSPLTDQYDMQHVIGKPHELCHVEMTLQINIYEFRMSIHNCMFKKKEQMEILGKCLRVSYEKHITTVTGSLSSTFFTSEAEIPFKQEMY